MEFFNKKEEVMEVVLTKKGKELFTKGKFTPKYYSFHDTDIIYENNSNEEQNEIVPRIKQTPTLKSITNIRENPNSELQYSIKCELGSKTIADQYAPAWNIKFVKSPPFQFVGDRDNITDAKMYSVDPTSVIDYDSGNLETIPQINILTYYKAYKLNVYEIQFDKVEYDNSERSTTLINNLNNFLKDTLGYFATSSDELRKLLSDGALSFDKEFGITYEQINKLFAFEYEINKKFAEEENKIEKEIQKAKDNLKKEKLDLNSNFSGFTNPEATKEIEAFNEAIKNTILKKLKSIRFPGFEVYKVAKFYIKKDPDLLVNVSEFNCFESNEIEKYEMECLLIEYAGDKATKLSKEEIRKFLNISVDRATDLQIGLGTKDIYGKQVEVDDSTC